MSHSSARFAGGKGWLAAATVAGILIIAAVLIFARTSKHTPQQTGEPVITYSTSNPDESNQHATNYNWRGNAEDPKKLKVEKLGIDTYIQKAGVDQNKQVAVPNNVHLAAWFVNTVPPGSQGLSVIDGHVSGKTAEGIFKNLNTLVNGDKIAVEMGSGKIVTYQVISTTQVKEAQAAKVLFSQDPTAAAQLNLITCGGNYDRAAGQYVDRVIISSKLVQG